MNLPIKQHYIPQFILKNFCFDKHHLYFCSSQSRNISIKNTKTVFMENNLYKSNLVNPSNPVQIENDFSKYEQEISSLIKCKILNKEEINLTLSEEASLRYFCALLGFRSKNTRNIFNNLSDAGKKLYPPFLEGKDFEELWKKSLSLLVKFRSFEEAISCKDLPKPIQAFMLRDCYGISGLYFVFFERRGPIDFIIGDCYPLVIRGCVEPNFTLNLISYYPLSPNMNMALVNNGAEASPCLFEIKKLLKKPFRKKDILSYKVKKLYERDINHINQDIARHSSYGIAFQDKNRICLFN